MWMLFKIAAERSFEDAAGKVEGPMGQSVEVVEQSRIAFKLAAKLIECAQSFFGFVEKMAVVFKMLEAERIGYVMYGDAMLLQLLAEEHILVAVVAEAEVERVGEYEVALHQEIGCVEVVVGMLLSLLWCVAGSKVSLVLIAQVVAHQVWVAANGDTSVNHCVVGALGMRSR